MKLPKLDDLGMREKIMLALAGVALCGMVISILSVPFVSKLKSIEKDTGRTASELGLARSLLACEDQMADVYSRMESRLGRSLSDAESIGDIKEDVEVMARSAGLAFDPPSHRDPAVDSGNLWREYIVELPRCSGSVDALLAFIGKIESANAVYRIEKMSMAPAKSGAGITATIVISRMMLSPEDLADGVPGS